MKTNIPRPETKTQTIIIEKEGHLAKVDVLRDRISILIPAVRTLESIGSDDNIYFSLREELDRTIDALVDILKATKAGLSSITRKGN